MLCAQRSRFIALSLLAVLLVALFGASGLPVVHSSANRTSSFSSSSPASPSIIVLPSTSSSSSSSSAASCFSPYYDLTAIQHDLSYYDSTSSAFYTIHPCGAVQSASCQFGGSQTELCQQFTNGTTASAFPHDPSLPYILQSPGQSQVSYQFNLSDAVGDITGSLLVYFVCDLGVMDAAVLSLQHDPSLDSWFVLIETQYACLGVRPSSSSTASRLVPSSSSSSSPAPCTINCPSSSSSPSSPTSNLTFCQTYSGTVTNATLQYDLLIVIVTRAVVGGTYSAGGVQYDIQGLFNPTGPLYALFSGQVQYRVGAPDYTTDTNALAVLAFKLVAYFGALFGCTAPGFPPVTSTYDMYAVHANMSIDSEQEGYFNTQLALTLLSLGVPQSVVADTAAPALGLFNRCGAPIAGLDPYSRVQICGTPDCTLATGATYSTCVQYYNYVTLSSSSSSSTASRLVPSSTSSSSPSSVASCFSPYYDLTAIQHDLSYYDSTSSAFYTIHPCGAVQSASCQFGGSQTELCQQFTNGTTASAFPHDPSLPYILQSPGQSQVSYQFNLSDAVGDITGSLLVYFVCDLGVMDAAVLSLQHDPSLDSWFVLIETQYACLGVRPSSSSTASRLVPSSSSSSSPAPCTINCPSSSSSPSSPTSNLTFCQTYSGTVTNATLQYDLLIVIVTRAVVGGTYSAGGVQYDIQGLFNPTGPLYALFSGQVQYRVGAPDYTTDTNALAVLAFKLVAYFGALFGCTAPGFPPVTSTYDMYAVHANMSIDSEQEGYFNTQLALTLLSLGVPQSVVADTAAPALGLFNRCGAPIAGLDPYSRVQICGTPDCTLATGATYSTCVQYYNYVTLSSSSSSSTASRLVPSSTSSSSPSSVASCFSPYYDLTAIQHDLSYYDSTSSAFYTIHPCGAVQSASCQFGGSQTELCQQFTNGTTASAFPHDPSLPYILQSPGQSQVSYQFNLSDAVGDITGSLLVYFVCDLGVMDAAVLSLQHDPSLDSWFVLIETQYACLGVRPSSSSTASRLVPSSSSSSSPAPCTINCPSSSSSSSSPSNQFSCSAPGYDLSPLRQSDLVYFDSTSLILYTIRPCGAVLSPNCQFGGVQTELCEQFDNGTITSAFPHYPSSQYSLLELSEGLLQYSSPNTGYDTEIIVQFNCSTDVSGAVVTAVEHIGTDWEVSIDTLYACPGLVPSPSSTGPSVTPCANNIVDVSILSSQADLTYLVDDSLFLLHPCSFLSFTECFGASLCLISGQGNVTRLVDYQSNLQSSAFPLMTTGANPEIGFTSSYTYTDNSTCQFNANVPNQAVQVLFVCDQYAVPARLAIVIPDYASCHHLVVVNSTYACPLTSPAPSSSTSSPVVVSTTSSSGGSAPSSPPLGKDASFDLSLLASFAVVMLSACLLVVLLIIYRVRARRLLPYSGAVAMHSPTSAASSAHMLSESYARLA